MAQPPASAEMRAARELVDVEMAARIRQEAFQRSRVMETLTRLTEDIGPRLTNSPAMSRANQWTMRQLRDWGLSNVHLDEVAGLGRGWEFSGVKVEMLSPRRLPLHALPKAWTPGTPGTVEGEAMALKLEKTADLEKYKGQLRGRILFLSDAREYKPGTEPDFHRHDEAGLAELQRFAIPKDRPAPDRAAEVKRFRERAEFSRALNRFLVEEGVLATVSISGWDNGIIRVGGGGSRKAGEPVGVPDLVMIAEHYNPVMRALERKEKVRLRLAVDARFTDTDDRSGYNTIAELPGGGRREEIVMLGAHLDSWHTGTGAADNAAGVAVMMEAIRILKAVGAQPRRTIRLGLWTGEEQGLLGSSDYVARHFARRPEPADPAEQALPASLRAPTGPLARTRDHGRLSAYFNMDNGSGRIRGIYAQENLAAMPIFEAWLKPFNDVGASVVVSRNTGSTDHIPFDRVGLPGFQFVQDRLDYFTNVHHSHLDTYDHVQPEDLKQAAAVIAFFAWQAANREEKLPRKLFVDEAAKP
ncbi:M20/M25/M40 family metallo-hydrolase [Lysobacter pythonis]|uniref:Carboxypeptidase Q n=2 Tax=Solilutibacter pythonis TaxID=2483112 RepID=A0A3M2I3L4_9GAMM|nr:M20/M25/M40 family metallo-hydrolase [Lysobacter pythonis]RMH94570.1 M20/M25/M40 family metallo-hydrolase [Lysobacter pythonis]